MEQTFLEITESCEIRVKEKRQVILEMKRRRSRVKRSVMFYNKWNMGRPLECLEKLERHLAPEEGEFRLNYRTVVSVRVCHEVHITNDWIQAVIMLLCKGKLENLTQ